MCSWVSDNLLPSLANHSVRLLKFVFSKKENLANHSHHSTLHWHIIVKWKSSDFSKSEHINFVEKFAEEMKVYFWFWFAQPSALRLAWYLYLRDAKGILLRIGNTMKGPFEFKVLTSNHRLNIELNRLRKIVISSSQ